MKKESLNIKTATKQYADSQLKIKELTEKQKPVKEFIVKYAKEHPSKFVGKTIRLDNGVSVQCKTNKDKCSFNQEFCTLEWLSQAIDEGLGEFITIDISLVKEDLSKKQKELLSEIDFVSEPKPDTYSVNI